MFPTTGTPLRRPDTVPIILPIYLNFPGIEPLLTMPVESALNAKTWFIKVQ